MEEQLSEEDELADDDPLLRAVAWVPRAEGALGQVELPAALRERVGSEPSAPSALPSVGEVIDGRYRIDARLGAGGMGVVFSATHLQIGKPVALKWMQQNRLAHSTRDHTLTRKRFEREARIAAHVRHPNVVEVYDASSDDSRSYLAMELLTGETLSARMRRARLGWEEAIALFAPILRGVSALHAHGVLHRDLKPDNIFLARAGLDAAPCPKVLDFGVASLRALESDASEASLTRAGSALGTPCYMPLEQLRGERHLDARTDVYALGVVLYEALSGRRPILAGNAAEHAALIASEGPRPLEELVPALRGPRAEAVMKALAREPRDRHASVDDFLASLLRADVRRPGRTRLVFLLACALVIAMGVAFYQRSNAVQSARVRPAMSAKPHVSARVPQHLETTIAPAPTRPVRADEVVPAPPTVELPASARRRSKRASPPRDGAASSDRSQAAHSPVVPAPDPNLALSRDDF